MTRTLRIAMRIAVEDLRFMARNRVAVSMLALSLLLTATASLVACQRQHAVNADRARYQDLANAQFDSQPDRHPHRVVHYGHYAFRPLTALAAFDPGIEPLTGHMVYLEGHRQNSANFSEARQSSLLLRFGEFTPAFVLQVLAPLLAVFLGFNSLTRERSGTLRLMLAQGVSGAVLMTGKWLALVAAVLLATLPAFAALGYIAAASSLAWPAALCAIAYAGYIIVWCGFTLIVSAARANGRDALLLLIGAWALLTIAVPRALPEIAATAAPLTTRVEADITIQRELASMGDSHNPDDPYFASFKEKVLAEHGVKRIEELPVNYSGLLALEGERMTSQLFADHSTRMFETLDKQNNMVSLGAWITPLIPLRQLSMSVAQSDVDSYRAFLEQAEAYRFELVQALNRMQAEQVSYADDNDDAKDPRIDAANFRALAHFSFAPPAQHEVLSRAAQPLLAVGLWLMASLLGTWIAARTLQKAAS